MDDGHLPPSSFRTSLDNEDVTVTHEVLRAIEAFDLTPREVRDILLYGFKRSFFAGTYLQKRAYVRKVIDFADRLLAEAGLRASKPKESVESS